MSKIPIKMSWRGLMFVSLPIGIALSVAAICFESAQDHGNLLDHCKTLSKPWVRQLGPGSWAWVSDSQIANLQVAGGRLCLCVYDFPSGSEDYPSHLSAMFDKAGPPSSWIQSVRGTNLVIFYTSQDKRQLCVSSLTSPPVRMMTPERSIYQFFWTVDGSGWLEISGNYATLAKQLGISRIDLGEVFAGGFPIGFGRSNIFVIATNDPIRSPKRLALDYWDCSNLPPKLSQTQDFVSKDPIVSASTFVNGRGILWICTHASAIPRMALKARWPFISFSRTETTRLYVSDIFGANLKVLGWFPSEFGIPNFVWKPDGSSVAFALDATLYVFDLKCDNK